MKPRNDREREVVRLSAALPPITDRQQQWAFDNCFDAKLYCTKSSGWCSECGGSFAILDGIPANKPKICPLCGATLRPEVTRRQHDTERLYYQVLATAGSWQVFRNFVVERFVAQGQGPRYFCHEVVQNWIDDRGREVIVARPVKGLTIAYDDWLYYNPMEVRRYQRRQTYYRYGGDVNKYHIHAARVYPIQGVRRLLRRNGFTTRCNYLPTSEQARMLIKDNQAEMLIKTRQYSLLGRKWTAGGGPLDYVHAIRIANRNRYIVRDASMWYDYLRLLDHFGLDTHNAHYVCPKNLKAAHDALCRRKRAQELKIEAEERRAKAARYEAKYRKDKGAYFGISFGNDKIRIAVIQSVAEMAEEGQAMHHCVYDMEYFKKADSLILSARDAKTDERIETVEVSLATFRVVQSRAHHNGISPQHDEILALVNNNIDAIRKINNRQRSSRMGCA